LLFKCNVLCRYSVGAIMAQEAKRVLSGLEPSESVMGRVVCRFA
jgi:hypothetical protein